MNLYNDIIIKEFIEKYPHLLETALIKGAISGDLIETSAATRGIGKTTALVNFAKRFGFMVVVCGEHIAEELSERFDYDNIHSEYKLGNGSLCRSSYWGNQFVVDEFTDLSSIPTEFHLVTGFYYGA